jgi:amino acid transporter
MHVPEGTVDEVPSGVATLTADEQQLAEMGYKQELNRSWSGFSNFAISFSIISILAGCFTTFSSGWNGGGPAAIAWGWPVLAALVLCIGLCLSELVSAYPTSGGIYWWASKLGGAKSGYYTGWLNLIGLLAITASVAYGCAIFLDATLGFFFTSWHSGSLDTIFLFFLGILFVASLVNIFSSHLLAIFNNTSVWWHVFGALAIILILIFLPHHHASVSSVFTSRVNNTGFFGGKTGGVGFLFIVLPIGALLTQYTITGYDASAHLSEETHSAANSAAKGIWRSIVYSAIGGYLLLLSFLFAVQDPSKVSAAGGGVTTIFAQALTQRWGGTVLLIATIGQLFCTMACMTSTTRMLFAFSRDGVVPAASVWSRLSSKRVPVAGVILVAVFSLVITAPALIPVDIAGVPTPIAFYAVVSIGVIGLYWCFAIPIWHRWRMGDRFQQGSWNLGAKYKVLSVVALLDVVLVSFMAFMPTSNLGVPWNTGFSMKYVNYTILVFPAFLIFLWIYWHASVKNWFTGPKNTIDVLPETPASSLP